MSQPATSLAEASAPPSPQELQWVRRPVQARSQKTLDRILDAAEKLICDKGFEAVGIADITREAGCSVGLFYSRFKDKQDLLRYLHERILGEALVTARVALDPSSWKGVPVRRLIRTVLEFTVRAFTERQRLFLSFSLAGRTDPILAQRQIELLNQLKGFVRDLVCQHASEMAHPDPQRAMLFAGQVVLDSIYRRALYHDVLVRDAYLTEEEFLDELERMIVGYLGIEGKEIAHT